MQWNEKTYIRALGWGTFFENIMTERHSNKHTTSDSESYMMHAKDQVWMTAVLAGEDGTEDPHILQALRHVAPLELSAARDLIDRYILHSPFIDLNQPLLCLVLRRPESKAAVYLQERYLVDTTLQVAHTIQKLLKNSITTNTTNTTTPT